VNFDTYCGIPIPLNKDLCASNLFPVSFLQLYIKDSYFENFYLLSAVYPIERKFLSLPVWNILNCCTFV